MTVASEAVTVSYVGNGATTAFTVTFPFFELVVETIVAGIRLEREEGSDYSITGGAGATGTVNFLEAPSSLTTVVIRRATSRLQATDYEENDPFPAEVHEQALDRAHMILSEIASHISRVRTLGLDDGSASELTISGGVIAPTGSYHVIDTENDDESDDLDTITPPPSVKDGDFLILRIASADRPITVKNGTGNLVLADDLVLESVTQLCWLMYVEPAESWVELNGRPGPQGEQGTPGVNGDGTGDVVGPSSATNNTIPRYDGTTGKLIKGSSAYIDSTDNLVNVRSGGVVGFFTDRTDTHGSGQDVGQMVFRGRDSAGNIVTYATIIARCVTATDGSEDGSLRFSTIRAGTAATRFLMELGLYANGVTGGDKGAGTINVDALYEANKRALTVAGSSALEAGFAMASAYDRGTVTTTAQTPTFAQGNVQKMVRNGAFTLNPPSSGDGHITIQVTNGASASTLTTSGFTKANVDELTDTSGDDFLFHITKIGSFSRLWVEALQ